MKDYYLEFVKGNLTAAEAFAAVYNLMTVENHIPAEDLDQDMLQELRTQRIALAEELAMQYLQQNGFKFNEYLGKYVSLWEKMIWSKGSH